MHVGGPHQAPLHAAAATTPPQALSTPQPASPSASTGRAPVSHSNPPPAGPHTAAAVVGRAPSTQAADGPSASASRAPAAGGPALATVAVATAAAVGWLPNRVANVLGPCASTGQAPELCRRGTLACLRCLGMPLRDGVLLAAVRKEAAMPALLAAVRGWRSKGRRWERGRCRMRCRPWSDIRTPTDTNAEKMPERRGMMEWLCGLGGGAAAAGGGQGQGHRSRGGGMQGQVWGVRKYHT